MRFSAPTPETHPPSSSSTATVPRNSLEWWNSTWHELLTLNSSFPSSDKSSVEYLEYNFPQLLISTKNITSTSQSSPSSSSVYVGRSHLSALTLDIGLLHQANGRMQQARTAFQAVVRIEKAIGSRNSASVMIVVATLLDVFLALVEMIDQKEAFGESQGEEDPGLSSRMDVDSSIGKKGNNSGVIAGEAENFNKKFAEIQKTLDVLERQMNSGGERNEIIEKEGHSRSKGGAGAFTEGVWYNEDKKEEMRHEKQELVDMSAIIGKNKKVMEFENVKALMSVNLGMKSILLNEITRSK